MSAPRQLQLGPFNRVEGDLEVTLEMADGVVRAARVTATMYRGFEQMLPGRDPLDALVIVPRICGICSVSQSVASARALADLAGVQPPPNGERVINLMLACENLADHLAHFYLFFMPDFTRADYAGRAWFAEAQRRFAALDGSGGGEHARAAVQARQRWFRLMGLLGGKWPHTQSVLPGGSSRPVEASERLRLLGWVREFRQFLEQQLFGDTLEAVAALDSEAALAAWVDAAPGQGDLRLFLAIAADLGLDRLGPGPGLSLSVGAYPIEGRPALAPGLWDASAACLSAVDLDQVREDAHHAWLADEGGPRHPWQGLTQPQADKPQAYSWNKAPRLGGRVLETGAMARQLADGQPLVRALVARAGSSVQARVLARLLEIARVLPRMEDWLTGLRPREPFHTVHTLPSEGQGSGHTEAARGTLGHWLRVEQGRLASYQIVAPTSWNFSPRDAQGLPGALEAALVGLPVREGESAPVAVQHIVRSFDPCMVCTVH
ncbi:nickel-dependent hydrogenase large subunit [Ideonella sp. 4Y11]|uniref:Nickel-dependent hydrogenase large subunit n=1 Tax=Ideonella aquatica TaxID=2824119 RepID=A0A940YJN9_9BURK|nr:nickel-dependent hydrogenase large subunit [Ideonella aquatica]MBQ0957481.1 nickel-dependent hydrogenase large subunit [Ideonella aquatica]